MFTSETIVSLNAEAALAAAAKNLEPFIPWDIREIETLGIKLLHQIPNIGSLDVSDAWEEIDTVMVDSSGVGTEGERALTAKGCLEFIKQQVQESASRGFAIVSQGQFQIVLGVFERL